MRVLVWRIAVAYREKPDLYGSALTPAERRQRRYLLWLLPPVLLGSNSVSIAREFGFKISHEIALYGVILMGVVCIAGAIISDRSARAAAARDIEELTHPEER
jgi:hypothetical protein